MKKDKIDVGANLLFVYGTLMKNQHNNPVLVSTKAEFVCKAATVKRYPLTVSGLPHLHNRPGQGMRVEGELWTMPAKQGWDRLDQFEGHPGFYKRDRVMVQDDAGNKLSVWCYFYQGGIPSDAKCVARFE